MKLLEMLKEVDTEDTRKMKDILKQNGLYNREHYIRMTEMINVNDVKLSIQASYGHHCVPTITTDYSKYSMMEFAIIGEAGFIGTENLQDFARIKELEETFDGSVFSFVPVDLIQDFIDYLGA